MGSTSLTIDTTRTVISQIRYKPWGETRYTFPSGSLPTNYQFTGQRNEVSLGLYFYQSRWYDPALGRFSQPDTIMPQTQGVQAWDRYAYGNNSPTNFTDPTGHNVKPPVCYICNKTWFNYSFLTTTLNHASDPC